MTDPFYGEIALFGFNFAPRNWAICDGSTLNIQQNPALYSLVTTKFGGDGQRTFMLPNLANRMIGGYGRGPGLTSRNVGNAYGAETVTLTNGQMPGHNHLLQAAIGRDVQRMAAPATTGGLGAYVGPSPYGTGSGATMGNVLSTEGGGAAHENRQPVLAMNFCIALIGSYPERP